MKKGTCHHDKLTRLKRIEGQVRGVHKMIEDERYCVDILHTVGATIGALKKLETAILKDHLDACVRNAFNGTSRKNKQEKIEEIHGLLEQLRK